MKFPKLASRAILSPMSGVTDVAFRALCRKYGAGLTYTEFVSGTAIVRGNIKTSKMLKTDEIEKPVAVQLFGNSFDDIVLAAKHVEKKFDVIDINCGCPAWKVIKTGAGSEMLKKPEGISKLVRMLVDSVKVPVTVKIRSGIDEKNINAIEVAKAAEQAGASAIAVHGRTQKQGYRGEADWQIIKKVKEAVEIPVIGNGDVFTPETFKDRLEQSNVDYIMLARGAIGNPGLFRQVNDYLEKGEYDDYDKLESFFEYLELAKKHKIEFTQIKTQAMNFTKGLEGSAKLRRKIALCANQDKLLKVIKKYNSTGQALS